MGHPQILILRAPGTNCDQETAFAFELAGGQAEFVHINQLIENPKRLEDFQIFCVPGGFSYGDDIAAGRVLASQFNSHLRDWLEKFREQSKLVLGICNGFQVLIKTGLLVAADDGSLPVTLTWNDNGRYECRWVDLKTVNEKCVFLRNLERLYLPVAHAEGRIVVRDDELIDRLTSTGQIAIKYVNPDGTNGDVPFPANPNGSVGNIAGICDPTGRIFGLMPHPERHVDFTQHPRWTREAPSGVPDGLKIFENAVGYFA